MGLRGRGLTLRWLALAATFAAPPNGVPLLAQASAVEWPRVGGTVPSRRFTVGGAGLSIGAGSAPGMPLLSGVIGATRLVNGGIVIGDASAHRVLFFDSAGRFVQEIGRLGDGPGEFRFPRWLGQCGTDTVAVFDAIHNSITYLGPAGSVIRSVPLPSVVSFDRALGCTNTGRLYFLLNRRRTRVGPGERPAVPTAVIRISPLVPMDTLFRGGVQEYYVAQASSAYSEVPLGRATLAAVGPTMLFVTENVDGRTRVYDPSGALTADFTLDIPRRRVSTRDWAIAKRARIEAEPLPHVREILTRVLSELRQPSTFPRIDQIQADTDDRLWVRTFNNFDQDIATWLVVSRTGTVLAAVSSPRNLQILEIGRGFLLGLARDSEGVERVELYSVPALP